LCRARVRAEPTGRGARCGVVLQQAAPPPQGPPAAVPEMVMPGQPSPGHQRSPQVRQGVVLPSAGAFRKRCNAARSPAPPPPRLRRCLSATPPAGTVTGAAWRKPDRAGQMSCVAGAPFRSAPRLGDDVTGPQSARLGSPHGSPLLPIEPPGWVAVLTPLKPGNWPRSRRLQEETRSYLLLWHSRRG
jgi:hypothetical protein